MKYNSLAEKLLFCVDWQMFIMLDAWERYGRETGIEDTRQWMTPNRINWKGVSNESCN